MKRPRFTIFSLLCASVASFAAQPYTPTEVEGKQLSAKLGASAGAVKQGEHVTLTLDLDLYPGMHVYAPGVEGYIPIDWKMPASPAAAAKAAVFPPSKKLFLPAVNETVPAYQGHFRLTREITVSQPGPITVTGALRYQACDDRVCYIPQTLALKWTFQKAAQ